jgi:Transposase C of IS166 homeodomain
VSANPFEPSEIIEQLKQQLDLTERQLGTTKQRLQYAELKIQVLEERLRLKRIQMYGPGSEKLSNEQLELLELEPGVSTAEVQAESAREPVRPAEKRVRQHPGRQTLPKEAKRSPSQHRSDSGRPLTAEMKQVLSPVMKVSRSYTFGGNISKTTTQCRGAPLWSRC